MYLVILIKFYCFIELSPLPNLYLCNLFVMVIVADSISLTTYKVVLLSIGNKLRNGYNTTLKPHPATPTSWPDHFESGGATPGVHNLAATHTAGTFQIKTSNDNISE